MMRVPEPSDFLRVRQACAERCFYLKNGTFPETQKKPGNIDFTTFPGTRCDWIRTSGLCVPNVTPPLRDCLPLFKMPLKHCLFYGFCLSLYVTIFPCVRQMCAKNRQLIQSFLSYCSASSQARSPLPAYFLPSNARTHQA